MTNYDKVMQEMTIEKLADLLTVGREEIDDGCTIFIYSNDTGTWYDYEEAIIEEIAWLQEQIA